ncbi:dual specificity protein phosphatase family protein [Spiroplasma culicicola]|uniref:Tyrosine specific protein phosphatases domain-containing protein n=1 Tax=Spiroplasma culicicola AES-1 TaxID=1276246 RepID=W6A6Q5_9MOLU|nr:dual specificity protein phosphatase [Spiroplasma culicicola]AHI52778.1 hypothetical protein SCULI_v1c04370 [Spiroplasma culicicola AES-1]
MKKIIDNLYLGDRHSAPNDTQLRISCAEEIFYNVADDTSKDIYWDRDEPAVYYKFEDYPDFNNMDINIIKDAINQIEENIDTKKIYVHCLWGVNRSASIVFMYMVRNNLIAGNTYKESQKAFWSIYPDHSPNPGWKEFLIKNYPYNF